ncbi:MAG TPA: NHLP family bacteriocin export ABC transporter peptidase/permease/ATPase subunit [Roseomonas sp.]
MDGSAGLPPLFPVAPDGASPAVQPGSLPHAARRRQRVPSVLQMEATECGAASLAMILASHGLWVPLEELRTACGVSRDGSNARNILRAARRYGLIARGYRVELAELHRSAFPMIAYWNFNHFVVLEGIDPQTGQAWINDPASGPRTVPADEFDRSFTGVALAFEPVDGFRRGGQPPSVLRGIASRMRRSQGLVLLLALLTVGLILPGLAAPVLTQFFVDEVLLPGFGDWFVPLLLGLGITTLARGGLTALLKSLTLRLETKLAVVEAPRMLWHVLRAPMEFFGQRYVGDIAARVASAERVTRLMATQVAAGLAALVSLLLYGTVMLLYQPTLAVVSLLLILGNTLFMRVMWRRQEDNSHRLARETGRMMSASVSTLSMIDTTKASGRETEAFARWAGVQAEYLNAQQSNARTAALLAAVPAVLARLTDVAILGIGGMAVMRGDMTVGELVAFQALAAGLAEPVGTLTSLGAATQAMKGELARLDDVLRYPVVPHLADTAAALASPPPLRLSGRLELQNLTFGYSLLDPPLLDGVSLVLEPGARVALVGGSGSGKSTLGRLAAGLYPPRSGRILLDGQDLLSLPPQTLAANVAYVDQSIFLFAGTVRENLTMWDPTPDDASLIAALADAQLLDVIEGRPGRLDSGVLESGANFSGGQRQRMEIARALAGNPALVILDEATAALDALVEERIETALRRRGCATLVIAHRLSTIRDADEIIVLDRGRIAQRGRHEELAAVDGPYRRLMHADEGDGA